MATKAEHLILRGIHLIIRTTFAPNDPAAQAKHFLALQSDLGPWFNDYAEEIAKQTEERKDDDDDDDTRGSEATRDSRR